MDELKSAILDYVRKEYVEDGDDRIVTENTPLITGGIVDSFSMVSLTTSAPRMSDTMARYCK